MKNIFHDSGPEVNRVYIQGNSGVRVGMREVTLQNNNKILLYDTAGVYAEKDYRIDIEKGLPKIREKWIAERAANYGENKSQLWFARQGIVTPEMEYVAIRENQGAQGENRITPEMVLEEIASGRAILPSNPNHPEAEPMIIGSKFLVKINANIGNSALGSGIEEEVEKA